MYFTYNAFMQVFQLNLLFSILLAVLLSSCTTATIPPTEVLLPAATATVPTVAIQGRLTASAPTVISTKESGFTVANGSRPLTFPADFGAHSNFRTEWWYYTGNLQTAEGRHFGFELTIFRVGLVSPTTPLPNDSKWSSRDLYFAHFALSDISSNHFYAFQRYSRRGPGLAGAEADPYHVWLEDWNITQRGTSLYQLQAEQEQIALDLTLTDEMGVVLQGENGYSRKGKNPSNASFYYSQPRLQADGFVKINGAQYPVSGLAWNDHEFSSGALDENQIGWDWFSLQFDDGSALMLFQLRERDGGLSESTSGTFITADKTPQSLHKPDFEISVLDHWTSPHTKGVYPSSWKVYMPTWNCSLDVKPWINDQEINFPPITYWEGAVHFEGSCQDVPMHGNGYVELTGYIGNLPLP